MAVSDGFASVIGQKYGHKTYKLLFSRKSYIGSLTFCISALVIGILALVCSNTANLVPAVLVSLLAAIVLTFVEAILSFGLDNLVLPPLAAFLLFSLVKLVV
jgi:dolichol kinase